MLGVPNVTNSYDPYSNAVAEIINGITKNEFQLEKYKVELETLRKIVAESVQIYNTERPHCSYSGQNEDIQNNKPKQEDRCLGLSTYF